MVGGVQLPAERPEAVQGGSAPPVTVAKSPVERILSAAFDAAVVVTFGVNVKDTMLDPLVDPPARHAALRL